MAPLVSVLIDTYNYGRFIEQAIDSVLDQEFPPERLELVVVDDGSTDDTAERVAKYGDRIRYLRKANGGQASAFNLGLAEARGEIVALLDSDDYWLPGKLARIAAEFETHPEAGMVYHRFYKRDSASGTVSEVPFSGVAGFLPANRNSLLRYDLHPTSTLAFRRAILDRLLPIPEEMVTQADAHLSACALFLAPVIYVPAPLTVYRVHGANLWHMDLAPDTRERLRRRMLTTRAAGNGVRQWLEKNGYDVNRRDLRAFLMQWTLLSRADEFALSPPGRLRFFAHLMRQGHYARVRMTWRHTIVFYLSALGSLLVGYRNFPRLDEWRLALKHWLRTAVSFRKLGV